MSFCLKGHSHCEWRWVILGLLCLSSILDKDYLGLRKCAHATSVLHPSCCRQCHSVTPTQHLWGLVHSKTRAEILHTAAHTDRPYDSSSASLLINQTENGQRWKSRTLDAAFLHWQSNSCNILIWVVSKMTRRYNFGTVTVLRPFLTAIYKKPPSLRSQESLVMVWPCHLWSQIQEAYCTTTPAYKTFNSW